MVKEHRISQRQACKAASLSQSKARYKSVPNKDEEVINILQLLIKKHPVIDFWQIYYRIRRMGYQWNHKRVHRVYTEIKLNIRRRFRKRLPARVKQALFQPDTINEVWSVDFMNYTLWDGRRFRLLNIVDDYYREVLYIKADISLPTMRLFRYLE
ncbi:MAG: hypothetical protein IM581_07120 [Chitinophagaceae bacterium]|nr:hypothetical protein [Chitinophagaceae bacterium]